MTKYYFIYPPKDDAFSPNIGIPQLMGYLKHNNIETKAFDLNAKLHNKIFNLEFIENLFFCFDQMFSANFINNLSESNKQYLEESIKIIKKNSLHTNKYFFKTNIAKEILKSKKTIYNPFLCNWALETINQHINLCFDFIFNFENKLFFSNLEIDNYGKETEIDINIDLLNKYFDEKNILYKELNKEIEHIINEKPECIGISINSISQLIPALYIAKTIKKSLKTHINIGGSFFTSNLEKIKQIKDLLTNFFDSISIGDSENTSLLLTKFSNKKIEIDEIKNLVYLNEKGTIEHKQDSYKSTKETYFLDLENYNKKDYLINEFFIPIRASKACYWGKCNFCNCSLGKALEFKKVEQLVEEIKTLKEIYNTNFFYFCDNALPPGYLEIFADFLINKKIKIYFQLNLRLEKDFNKKLLKKLRKAGLIKVFWGLETASQELLNKMNKGIDINCATEVLKNAYKNGISNTLFLLMGYPTETKKDIETTIQYLKKYKRFIDGICVTPNIGFVKGSTLEKNKISNIKEIKTTLKERLQYQDEMYKIFKDKNYPWYLYTQISILYFQKYGSKNIVFLNKYTDIINKYKYFKEKIYPLKNIIKVLRNENQ